MVQTPSPLMSSAALHCPAWLSGLRRALAKRLPVVTRAAGSNPAPTVLHEYEAVWVQCKGVVVDAYPETHEYTVEVLSESGETLGVVSVPKRRVYTRA